MRCAFVGAECEENLSLRYLGAAARGQGHQVCIVTFNFEGELPAVARRLAAGGFQFVGLSIAFQHRAREFIELARRLRAEGYGGHLCCGGHVPTPAWRELLAWAPEIDTVVRHDGEQTLVELLGALSCPERWPEIEGVCCRDASGAPLAAPPRRQPDDLDALPFPLRVTPHVEHVGLKFAPIVGSRGCYGDCNYCCINSWHRSSSGRRLRFRSVESLATEMAYLYHDRDVRIFCFHDDTFFLPRPRDTVRRLRGLRAELDRRRVGRIGMTGKCRPDGVDDAMLAAARRCGVFRMYIGVENGSDRGLRNLGRRHDLAACEAGLAAFRRQGVFACYNLLLFEPDTRLADLEENLAFMGRTSDFPFNFCRAEVYEGSRFARRLKEQGRLAGSFLGYSYEIEDPRAELAYRLMSVCFRGRNFSMDGVANVNTGMGYEAAVLRHFYGDAGEPLARQVDALVREVNEDTVRRLGQLLAYARGADLGAFGAACDFAEQLATEINFADLALLRRQHALRAELKRFAAGSAPSEDNDNDHEPVSITA